MPALTAAPRLPQVSSPPSAARRSELLDSLTKGVARLVSSEQWQRHLEIQARFHHYSANNVVLIAGQFPEATQVAGFRAWRKLGRQVKRGEKAIWILAPVIIREGDDDRLRGFRPVPVFDVSQTEGEPLPAICTPLVGDDDHGLFARLVRVAGSLGYTVVRTPIEGSTHGDCSFVERRIRIEARNDRRQQVKTLAHEVTHALLHEGVTDRGRAELEAESVAYVVCRQWGIDSGTYSFGYVAAWAGGGDEAIAGITASCTRIQSTAAHILGSVADDLTAPRP